MCLNLIFLTNGHTKINDFFTNGHTKINGHRRMFRNAANNHKLQQTIWDKHYRSAISLRVLDRSKVVKFSHPPATSVWRPNGPAVSEGGPGQYYA
jgi:hypothetical protein